MQAAVKVLSIEIETGGVNLAAFWCFKKIALVPRHAKFTLKKNKLECSSDLILSSFQFPHGLTFWNEALLERSIFHTML